MLLHISCPSYAPASMALRPYAPGFICPFAKPRFVPSLSELACRSHTRFLDFRSPLSSRSAAVPSWRFPFAYPILKRSFLPHSPSRLKPNCLFKPDLICYFTKMRFKSIAVPVSAHYWVVELRAHTQQMAVSQVV